MYSLDDLSVIIPSYNEDHNTLDKIVYTLESCGAEVIVVDDGSIIPYTNSIKIEKNSGYGFAIMTGILHAKNDLIMTIDGDGQHSLYEVLRLYKAWKIMPKVDLLIGSRRCNDPFNRVLARKIINITASLIANKWFCDLNSGIRMFRKSLVTGYFPILCKRFSFTTSLTMSMYLDGYTVEWFPIKLKAREKGESNVRIWDVFRTFYYILKIGVALRTRTLRNIYRKLNEHSFN